MKVKKYNRFTLILMMTHDCNLRCRYCYSGEKTKRKMPIKTALTAIKRAIASMIEGGCLELGFFGGEPCLEAELIEEIIQKAIHLTEKAKIGVKFFLTTNGTVTTNQAWNLLLNPQVRVSVSCDGLPESHDQNRVTISGKGSSQQVYDTIKTLLKNNKLSSVVTVISPDTIVSLADNIRYFISLGIKRIEPNLNLWTKWSLEDLERLKAAIKDTQLVWQENFPEVGITWFDEKLLMLTGHCLPELCRFGKGEIAVAPGGALYPCERLIGNDEQSNPFRLPGNIESGEDFLATKEFPSRTSPICDSCGIKDYCSTNCRCANFVRSGKVSQPDKLLCYKEKACIEGIAAFLKQKEEKKNE